MIGVMQLLDAKLSLSDHGEPLATRLTRVTRLAITWDISCKPHNLIKLAKLGHCLCALFRIKSPSIIGSKYCAVNLALDSAGTNLVDSLLFLQI
jgi:hypothetical protein